MSKRKLSRQQAWRVEKIQQERAERSAKRDAQAEEVLVGGELGPEREGLIVAHYGTQVAVESAPGVRHRCHMRANLEGLVTGDRVVWREGESLGVVVAALDRDSELCRPDPQGNLKPVAANIDQIMIVVAPYPEAHANLIDRYLIASEAVSIRPIIVLNKIDLLDQDTSLRDSLEGMLSTYIELGYTVLKVSAKQDGLESLNAALESRTSIFVGQSGVGKSSLVNALLPEANIRVGALSENTLKGTHTTTTAQLMHLRCGGRLIDSPGIREFGLWHMNRQQIEEGFIEFQPFLGTCKFRDCEHRSEPNCALLDAVAAQKISTHRLASYRHIVQSLEEN